VDKVIEAAEATKQWFTENKDAIIKGALIGLAVVAVVAVVAATILTAGAAAGVLATVAAGGMSATTYLRTL
jgi:hypothetical protein